jgi:4-deoxy-L-threo-5-hexosulose-uronate ketol-isomerase
MFEGTMKIVQVADAIRFPHMSTQELRDAFLVQELFQPEQINLVHVDLDRAVVGSAVPIGKPLRLETNDVLKSSYFTERRELGVFNIGSSGNVQVEDHEYNLEKFDGLYVGRGSKQVSFASQSTKEPAEFYLLSYPAHTQYPTTYMKGAVQKGIALGYSMAASRREIVKLIHAESTKSCQLMMGFTKLEASSCWNSMPPHAHMRRSEIYRYFDLTAEARVIHLMGPSHETRHLVVANKQAIVSPGWSIHAGVGTQSYSFCWGMGGGEPGF